MGGDVNRVFGNLVDGNIEDHGISIYGHGNVIGPYNEAIENELDGIYLSQTATNNEVVENLVGGHQYSYGNHRHGINVLGSYNLVKQNFVEDNEESGIYVNGRSNKVTRNLVCQNHYLDIEVTATAHQNVVRHNQAAVVTNSNSTNVVKNTKRCR